MNALFCMSVCAAQGSLRVKAPEPLIVLMQPMATLLECFIKDRLSYKQVNMTIIFCKLSETGFVNSRERCLSKQVLNYLTYLHLATD